jgi:hypothetical protein
VQGKQFTFKRGIKGKDGVYREITADFLTSSEKKVRGENTGIEGYNLI